MDISLGASLRETWTVLIICDDGERNFLMKNWAREKVSENCEELNQKLMVKVKLDKKKYIKLVLQRISSLKITKKAWNVLKYTAKKLTIKILAEWVFKARNASQNHDKSETNALKNWKCLCQVVDKDVSLSFFMEIFPNFTFKMAV